MRKIFTFLLSVLFVSTISAQHPEAVLPKATTLPVIGGDIDAVWDDVDANAIDKNFQSETPTLGQPGETWWKGMWSDKGIYLVVNVTDNDYYPYYAAQDEAGAQTGYQYDQIELYFACNYVNNGGTSRPNSTNGNYQIAPAVPRADDGTEQIGVGGTSAGGDSIRYSYNADGAPNWFTEWFVPFTYLKDENGVQVDISGNIGFDVTVIDNDRPGGDSDRQRAVWSNDGAINESWANVTDVGTITLEGAEVIYVDAITLTGGEITSDNEPFQVGVDIEPADATDKSLKWIVDPSSTARARIDANGVVTPITDGDFIVTATSSDGFVYSNTVTISISGQDVKMEEISLIKNGLFDQVDPETLKPTGGWSMGTGGTVVEGVAWCTPPSDGGPHNTWDWQLSQNIIPITMDEINDPFLFQFKLWADVADTINIDFEDSNNSYSRYGVSSDPESNGSSDWTFVCNTEPTTYKFHLTFANMQANANQRMQMMLGRATAVVYVDSVFLVKEADLPLITGVTENSLAKQSINVYPNPATSTLNVDLPTANTKVAIYNSVGIKMDEVIVPGTHHSFDVSKYTPGVYFVKTNESVVKFMR